MNLHSFRLEDGEQVREDKQDGKSLINRVLALTLAVVMVSGAGFVLGADQAVEPDVWVQGDFVISYDEPGAEELWDASNPSVATTPWTEATIGKDFAGSIHAVWHEINELTGIREIHHSMSPPGTHGMEWTNDEEHEGDHIISQVDKARAPLNDALNPQIAIDSNGAIHVVWSQQYEQDGTWEIHYSRSEDNGKTWTGEGVDRIISERRMK